MEGLIAQAYAATHPDRIAGLILADTFTPGILTRGERFLRRVVLNALIPPARLVGYERIEKANVWVTERLFSGSSGGYENVERLRETGPEMTTDEFVKAIRSMARPHRTAIDLSAIAVPTLVLYGENELPFVKRHAAELAARVPDVEVDQVPDAGHASDLDNPAYFTTALRTFLARHVRADLDEGGGTGSPDPDGSVESGSGNWSLPDRAAVRLSTPRAVRSGSRSPGTGSATPR